MKFTDQFTINLNSQQHSLLCEIISESAGLDLPPTQEDSFDSLWENVINADHKIIEEVK